jgi:hypothetical protein
MLSVKHIIDLGTLAQADATRNRHVRFANAMSLLVTLQAVLPAQAEATPAAQPASTMGPAERNALIARLLALLHMAAHASAPLVWRAGTEPAIQGRGDGHGTSALQADRAGAATCLCAGSHVKQRNCMSDRPEVLPLLTALAEGV